jgi:predicted SAM-dependent methyltransferase
MRAFGRKVFPPSTLWRYRELYDATLFRFKSLVGRLCRLFYRPALPSNEGNAVYLHLGCGPVNHPKFINIDLLPEPHIHYVRSVDNLSHFKDCSVDLIYASHCLEHFSFHIVPEILKEWYRVLRPNGILRLSSPDFDLLLKIYVENERDISSIINPLMGGQDSIYNYHKTIFNKASLTFLLKSAGFNKVSQWLPQSSELTTLDDWSARCIVINGREYPVSLNIEAVK